MSDHVPPSQYPLRVEGELDSHLSRRLWLVKWVLAIPHFIALLFLWIAFVGVSVVAFFAILFTGRYAGLMTDAYLPFRLDMGGQEPEPDTAAADRIAPSPAGELS